MLFFFLETVAIGNMFIPHVLAVCDKRCADGFYEISHISRVGGQLW